MQLSCSNSQNIKDFLEVLKNYDLKHIKIDVQFGSALGNPKNALLEELKQKNISFEEALVSDSGEESDEDLIRITNYENPLAEGSMTKSLEDKCLVAYMKTTKIREQLVKLSKTYMLNIDLGEKASITGEKMKVEEFVKVIQKVKYSKSDPMTHETANCLYKTKYFKNILREHGLCARICKHEEKEKHCLILFGDNQENLEKGVQKVNKISKNLFIPLELSKQFEQANEMEKIAEYFTSVFNNGKLKYEFGVFQDKRYNKNLIFYLAKCKEDDFKKIKNFIENHITSMCFLNVLPKSDMELPLIATGVSKEKVNIMSLSDRSYLVLGKAKYMKDKIKEISKMENKVDCFRLRFKRLCDGSEEEIKQQEFIPKNMRFLVQELAERGVHVFKMSNGEALKSIVCSFDELLNQHRHSTSVMSLSETSVSADYQPGTHGLLGEN